MQVHVETLNELRASRDHWRYQADANRRRCNRVCIALILVATWMILVDVLIPLCARLFLERQ